MQAIWIWSSDGRSVFASRVCLQVFYETSQRRLRALNDTWRQRCEEHGNAILDSTLRWAIQRVAARSEADQHPPYVPRIPTPYGEAFLLKARQKRRDGPRIHMKLASQLACGHAGKPASQAYHHALLCGNSQAPVH